jgi:GAF domain-containing protein
LSVPLLRDNESIGAILLRRTEVYPFNDKQIALLKTFADQAVIAVENVRLFTELGIRNRDLTEALEQQTATGAILRVIAASPTDIQPVLQIVAESAARFCDTHDAVIVLPQDGMLAIKARQRDAQRDDDVRSRARIEQRRRCVRVDRRVRRCRRAARTARNARG